MIPKGLFTQIGMIIVSVAIIVTYVQPEFSKISEVQNSIEVFKTERAKVESVNAKLGALMSSLKSVSNDDVYKLNTYMPNEVDEISVRRDMLLITKEAGLLYIDSGSESDNKRNNSRNSRAMVDNNGPDPVTFTLAVEGSYDQVKNLFDLIEHNHYPLEVTSLEVSQLEGGFLTANLDIRTYSYKTLDANN